MRQVPKYTIIGDGRVATHLQNYFQSISLPFNTWSRKLEASKKANLAEVLFGSDVVLVLIKDGAIEPWIQENIKLMENKTLIHFSGSLVTPLAQGFHPLMTFSTKLYTPEKYLHIPFVVERGLKSFSDVFPILPNPSYEIEKEEKPFYHAWCVMSGNFSTLLWQKLFRELEKMKIPASAGRGYLNQLTENLIGDFESALTGPLSRGDDDTLQKNLKALKGEAYQNVYLAFVEAYKKEKASMGL